MPLESAFVIDPLPWLLGRLNEQIQILNPVLVHSREALDKCFLFNFIIFLSIQFYKIKHSSVFKTS